MKAKIFLLIFLVVVSLSGTRAQQQSPTWDFEYPGIQPGRARALDLRYLNERVAGEHGFIKISPDGNSFVRGDGAPVRFWPINEFAFDLTGPALQNHARFLAGMGVNMCRYHVCLNAKGKETLLFDFDMGTMRKIWEFVATMKKEGIYSTISPFWPHNYMLGGWVPAGWNLKGYEGVTDMWGLFYFSDTLRAAYRNWTRALYTLTNPYTGIALKDDPAVAIIQIMNEDGVFWWSMDEYMKPRLKELIVKQYVSWLAKKYGTLDNAFKTWGTALLPGDNPALGYADIYLIRDMTIDQSGDKAIRIRDQVRFYAETQFKVYREIYDFYRNELGCPHLINTMNWTAANAGRLLDIERWTNTAAEVLATNRYFDPVHDGENNGWRIDPGHVFAGPSALLNPVKLPLNIKQASGHPFIITESGWNLPNKNQAEGPFLVSVYQSLTGLDGYYWFANDAGEYNSLPYYKDYNLPDGQYPMQRWTCAIPGMMAQFPANALLYRLGYLRQGEPVIFEKKSFQSLIEREVSKITELRSYDPNRIEGSASNLVVNESEISPLVFLTGPVVTDYKADESSIKINGKLNYLIDLKSSTVKSITGEQILDYRNGICEVNSPRARGVCGFLSKKGTFNLGGLKIVSKNEYAAIWVISLDNLPLESSGKILIQCGTRYLPTGWKDEPAEFVYSLDKVTYKGLRVINTGQMPWQADNTQVTIEIMNPSIMRATLLDVAGYASREIPVKRTGGKMLLTLPLNALYVILEKQEPGN
jgi:hypothetical protein